MKNVKKRLLEMAKNWQCETNEMVISLIDQYENQYKLIDRLYTELSDPECTFVETKEDRYHGVGYTINPILKEISKLTDACNRTASLIITTIEKVGVKPEIEVKSALDKFFEEEEDGEKE